MKETIMITDTLPAAQQIRLASKQNQSEGMALRIAAQRLQDGSIQYGMGFDTEREHDIESISEGVTILISSHSKDLLSGTVVDFVELAPGEYQFIFINPNDTDASVNETSSSSQSEGS